MNQEGVDLKNVFNADEDEGLKLSPDSKSMYKDVLDGFAKWFLRFMGFRGLKSLIPDDPESPKFDLNIKTAGLIRNRLFTYIHFHSQFSITNAVYCNMCIRCRFTNEQDLGIYKVQ